MPEGARRGSLTIGALSRATGIPSATLRTWERRYNFPRSVRKPSGHRLYSIEGVAHLLRVKSALALGHRPAEILRLPAAALESLVTLPAAPNARVTSSAVAAGLAEPKRPVTQADDREAELLQSVVSFDRAELERGLRARWASIGPVRFLDECAGPFLESLGMGWREGRLEVRHEHFASSLLADLLRELRRPYDDRASGPWVAATTFPGDRHEIGLLMASLLCAVRGWRVLYVGVDTPIDQIAALSREVPLSAIALSVSPTVPQAYAFALTLDLRRKLPEPIAIWLGGKGSSAAAPGVLPFIDLETLDRHLSAIAGGSLAGRST
jgi:DNA-binding transcriptional MerR regulator